MHFRTDAEWKVNNLTQQDSSGETTLLTIASIIDITPLTADAQVIHANKPSAKEWPLFEVPVYVHGVEAKLIGDTGSSRTLVTREFVERAKTLKVRPYDGPPQRFKAAQGSIISPCGVTDIPMFIYAQISVDNDDGSDDEVFVHWERHVVLKNVYVLDLGSNSPRDIYLSSPDFDETVNEDATMSPFAEILRMARAGIKLIKQPRLPKGKGKPAYAPVVALTQLDRPVRNKKPKETSPSLTGEALVEAIKDRFPKDKLDSPLAQSLIKVLAASPKIYTPVNPDECTEEVEFTLTGTPTPVSFQMPVPSSSDKEKAARDAIMEWIDQGIAEKVPWDTPSYGFAFLIRKRDSNKFRVTISASEVGLYTAPVAPKGGYMPRHMFMEALKVGIHPYAVQLDLRAAFNTLKLGPTARRLSTVTTPIGKVQFKNGWFGWHGFPGVFQTLMMEKIVLPVLDEVEGCTIIAWIDDLVVSAPNPDALLQAVEQVVRRLLSIGARLSLEKCSFLPDRISWCGVQLDLATQTYRPDPGRVSSLVDTAVPKDRTDLQSLLGTLRYYFYAVPDQNAQRARLKKLSELDVERNVLKHTWTAAHTETMQEALKAITTGNWINVYDPSKEVHIQTDASGNHGYCVVANQFTADGKLEPIMFYSKAWDGNQANWLPQQAPPCQG